MTIRYASVCDGIGAVHCAWNPLGWECAWTSEIDPFPIAVVDQRWGFPNVGDMTKIKKAEVAGDYGRIHLLVGGTPCQSFSVAGLRSGLDDPRGNLSLVFLGLADQFRPEWLVWENVPGVLSSDEGRDFGSILGGMAELGYGWAYRVMDAQYVRVESHPFAVPQRRRRVFVVAHLGGWRRAAAVLFEREGMRGHPPPSRIKGEIIAADVAPCLVSSGRGVERTGDTRGQDPVVATYGTLNASDGEKWGSNQWVDEGKCIIQPYPVANCMTRRMHKGINSTVDEGQTPILSFTNNGGNTGLGVSKDHSPPMTAINSGHPMMASGLCVRRLMPIECERLQGFPDDYTLVNYRGNPAKDSPRYKALGNLMAVNVMSWIGRRIEEVNELDTSKSCIQAAIDCDGDTWPIQAREAM